MEKYLNIVSLPYRLYCEVLNFSSVLVFLKLRFEKGD